LSRYTIPIAAEAVELVNEFIDYIPGPIVLEEKSAIKSKR
jgi:hypothetical protein